MFLCIQDMRSTCRSASEMPFRKEKKFQNTEATQQATHNYIQASLRSTLRYTISDKVFSKGSRLWSLSYFFKLSKIPQNLVDVIGQLVILFIQPVLFFPEITGQQTCKVQKYKKLDVPVELLSAHIPGIRVYHRSIFTTDAGKAGTSQRMRRPVESELPPTNLSRAKL